MKHDAIALSLTLLVLGGCGGSHPDREETPGAAERYLDNVLANEPATDRAATANGADEISPASGKMSPGTGEAPVFSREPVPPRR